MPFFLNPFGSLDFFATWVLNNQFSPGYKCPRNSGRGDEFVLSHATAPYNLSGNDADAHSKNVLTLSFALNDRTNWNDLPVTITGAVAAAVTPAEVVLSLQSNALFTDFFTASLDLVSNVHISQKKSITNMIFYVKSGRAETVLNFNKFAGVAELPAYFSRHTIANRFLFTDSQNALIALDPVGSAVDAATINNAVDPAGRSRGFVAGTLRADWQLLAGKGDYLFRKTAVDVSNRVTQVIEYSAGSIAGDVAKKTVYVYSGALTNPVQTFELPYTLESGDLVTPP